MPQSRSLRFTHLVSFVLAMFFAPAFAQESWPTIEDIQKHGEHLVEAKLEQILAGNTAVVGTGPGAPGSGAILRCGGPKTPILTFGGVSGGLEIGSCRVEGSAVCVNRPGLDGEACYEIRRSEAYGGALFGFEKTGTEDQGDAGGGAASNRPAMAIALVPTDVYGLAAASGEIDLGGMTVTLPSKHRFTLVHASSYPLRFIFQGEADRQTLVLFLEQLGWPDQHAQPNSVLAEPLPLQPQIDFLANWEWGYARRDLREWGFDEGLELFGYRSETLYVDGSPCVKVHESITAAGRPVEADTPVAEEHRSQHLCISLTKGALLGVTLVFQPLDMGAEQAEEFSEAIFSTVRLSPGAGDEALEETTLASFHDLQGGDPDLTWETLDCVQGWNRAAQINGCNHSIRRYSKVIAAGDWLLAGDLLSDQERRSVEKTVRGSRTTLAIVHSVRAELMQEEAPAQTRDDCAAAQRIARELGDEALIESFAACP